MTTPEHINDALLWLVEHRGKITFSVDENERLEDLEPSATVVRIEARAFTEAEGKTDGEPLLGVAQIDRVNVVGAILAAIQAARESS